MFNKELFLKLCEKYGVQFSSEYDTTMINDNGKLRPLVDSDIADLVPNWSFDLGGAYDFQDVEEYEFVMEENVLAAA